MSEIHIGAIARTDYPALGPDTPIRRAVAVLVDTRAAAAPVLDDDGRLVGILTQRDCFAPALHASYHREWTGRVADHMSREVVTVSADDDVIAVARMFMDLPHRVLPVLDASGVAGLVHRSDVLRLLTEMG